MKILKKQHQLSESGTNCKWLVTFDFLFTNFQGSIPSDDLLAVFSSKCSMFAFFPLGTSNCTTVEKILPAAKCCIYSQMFLKCEKVAGAVAKAELVAELVLD